MAAGVGFAVAIIVDPFELNILLSGTGPAQTQAEWATQGFEETDLQYEAREGNPLVVVRCSATLETSVGDASAWVCLARVKPTSPTTDLLPVWASLPSYRAGGPAPSWFVPLPTEPATATQRARACCYVAPTTVPVNRYRVAAGYVAAQPGETWEITGTLVVGTLLELEPEDLAACRPSGRF